MEITKTLEIIKALSQGIDPHTGEIYPPVSPYQHPDTIRALFEAINTTTLNSFTVNHKACIPGLELGLDAPFNFAEMQKHLKILSFHF